MRINETRYTEVINQVFGDLIIINRLTLTIKLNPTISRCYYNLRRELVRGRIKVFVPVTARYFNRNALPPYSSPPYESSSLVRGPSSRFLSFGTVRSQPNGIEQRGKKSQRHTRSDEFRRQT